MNAGDVLSWVGALCGSVVMLAITAQIVRNTFTPKHSGTKSIIRKK